MPKSNPTPAVDDEVHLQNQDDRQSAFRSILEMLDMDPDDPTTTGEEDAANYLDGTRPLKRFCLVTQDGEYSSVSAYALEEAITQYARMADSPGCNWGEVALNIYDLDENKEYRPDFAALPWHPTP